MCPFCNKGIKCDFRLVFTHRCKNCNKNIVKHIVKPYEKRYKIYSGVSVVISIFLFSLISCIGGIYINNDIILELIAFFLPFFLLCLIQFLILREICKSYLCDANR